MSKPFLVDGLVGVFVVVVFFLKTCSHAQVLFVITESGFDFL